MVFAKTPDVNGFCRKPAICIPAKRRATSASVYPLQTTTGTERIPTPRLRLEAGGDGRLIMAIM